MVWDPGARLKYWFTSAPGYFPSFTPLSQTCVWLTAWVSEALAIRCTAPTIVAPFPGVEITTLLDGDEGLVLKKSAMAAAFWAAPGQAAKPMTAHTVLSTFSW